MEDESEIKQRILENIEEYVTSGLSKKVTNILETIKPVSYTHLDVYKRQGIVPPLYFPFRTFSVMPRTTFSESSAE